MKDKPTSPLFLLPVRAGFPTPQENYHAQTVSIDDLVVKNPVSTFYVRIEGDSMEDDNIHDGDIIVVDKSLTAKNNTIVVARVENEFTVKRYFASTTCVELRSQKSEYTQIMTAEIDWEIWGCVTYVIHKAK